MSGLVKEERRKSNRRGATLRLLAYLLVIGVAIFATARTYQVADESRRTAERVAQVQRQTAREGVERRNQACRADESENLRTVNRLTGLYDYINNTLTAPSYDRLSEINKAVVRSVPEVEAEARVDTAPEFCDETLPGGVAVGLPEPDPIIPKRPERVAMYLEQAGISQDRAKAKRIAQDLRNPDQRS